MGDNGGDKSQDVILTITHHSNGCTTITGPIPNEPLCFWMLDKAKDIIKVKNIEEVLKNKPRIAKPHGIMQFVRGKH